MAGMIRFPALLSGYAPRFPPQHPRQTDYNQPRVPSCHLLTLIRVLSSAGSLHLTRVAARAPEPVRQREQSAGSGTPLVFQLSTPPESALEQKGGKKCLITA